MSYTLRRPAVATARAPHEAIAAAIEGRGFTLALQPVVSVDTRAPDHAEALLRPPAQPPRAFVAAADAAGLGAALDASVLAMAMAMAMAREAPGPVSVNVCARSLQQRGFVRTVLDAGVPAIELVRIDAIDDLAAIVAAIAELRACGVRVALDEVDGGAASLALLQAARFDALKLSGAVVRAAMAGARAHAAGGAAAARRRPRRAASPPASRRCRSSGRCSAPASIWRRAGCSARRPPGRAPRHRHDADQSPQFTWPLAMQSCRCM